MKEVMKAGEYIATDFNVLARETFLSYWVPRIYCAHASKFEDTDSAITAAIVVAIKIQNAIQAEIEELRQ